MALPAVICYYLFSPFLKKSRKIVFAASFLAGAGSVFISCLFLGLALYFTEKSFLEVSLLVITANLPVMIIEGFVTGFCVTFLQKVYPEILFRDGKNI